jgi:hypothetical protein
VTIIFGGPIPENSTANLSCTDQSGQSYETDQPYQFVAVFPNIVSMAADPGTVLKGLSGVTSYEIRLL